MYPRDEAYRHRSGRQGCRESRGPRESGIGPLAVGRTGSNGRIEAVGGRAERSVRATSRLIERHAAKKFKNRIPTLLSGWFSSLILSYTFCLLPLLLLTPSTTSSSSASFSLPLSRSFILYCIFSLYSYLYCNEELAYATHISSLSNHRPRAS